MVLFADLDKLINKQKLSYKISLSDIPISKKLKDLMLKNLKKLTSYLKVMIIKYYLLHLRKARIIKRTFKSLGIKVTKIGKICSSNQKSQIIDEKGNKITIKNKGYLHKF